MPQQPLIAQILEALLDLGTVMLLIWSGIRWIKQKRQQKRQTRKPRPIASKTYYASVGDKVWYAHLPGNAYEVGSPEYNAQLAGAIRALNERLATEGKRIPENVTIDIVHQINEEYGQQ